MQYSFILVEPGEAGNIGAAARALNTMGFTDLRLVRPQADHLSGVARAFAHGSEQLLEKAAVYETLPEAIANIDFVCATTARHRIQKYHYVSVRDLPQVIQQKGTALSHVAVVFGSERSGLSNKDLEQCDLLTTIPQVRLQPSLNLSQAVMLYSFTLSQQKEIQIVDQRMNSEQMPIEQYAYLKKSLGETLERVGLNTRYRGYVMKAIARLGYEDLYLIQTIRTFINNQLDKAEIDRPK
ncbi:MAG: TrmH family RNA methyltransferase [Cyanobacteria bacterium P01_D01_bin.105]